MRVFISKTKGKKVISRKNHFEITFNYQFSLNNKGQFHTI